MSSRIRHLIELFGKHTLTSALCLALSSTAAAGLLSPNNRDDSQVANVSLQALTDVHTTCLLDAIQKEEAENLLGVVTVLHLKPRCQQSRERLELKTSKLKTTAFETMYLKFYYLEKAGDLANAIIPVDKIIDLE
jgi:hypothetical protein